MLTPPDLRRLHYHRHRPLPDREGILSPVPVRQSRKGKAGGNYLRMENRHPAACFAPRPELESPRAVNGFHPMPQGEASGNIVLSRPFVSARMLLPYWTQRVRAGLKPAPTGTVFGDRE